MREFIHDVCAAAAFAFTIAFLGELNTGSRHGGGLTWGFGITVLIFVLLWVLTRKRERSSYVQSGRSREALTPSDGAPDTNGMPSTRI